MIEESFHRAAVIASYFWEFVEIPSHAERLGLLRALRRQAEADLRCTAEEELARLRVVADEAASWDAELARALGLGSQRPGALPTDRTTRHSPSSPTAHPVSSSSPRGPNQ